MTNEWTRKQEEVSLVLVAYEFDITEVDYANKLEFYEDDDEHGSGNWFAIIDESVVDDLMEDDMLVLDYDDEAITREFTKFLETAEEWKARMNKEAVEERDEDGDEEDFGAYPA